VVRFDSRCPLGARFQHRGTHTFGLADVIELARALDGLPSRLAGYGVEGAAFEFGTGLSPDVESAVQSVTSQLLRELNSVTKGPPSQDVQP
jgi:hydrogenase maturation protease